MGNNSYANIVGIDDMCVRANTGYTLILKDVRHVPDICLNLISTHFLDKKVMAIIFVVENGGLVKDH